MRINSYHGGYPVGDDHPPVIVGVINLSPESFYIGSVAEKESEIEKKIHEMKEYGAHILDVGAISSRPVELYGGKIMGETEEKERIHELLPQLLEIANSFELPVAMDTQSSSTAELALELGCTIINDISGLKNDPLMAKVVSDHNADLVVMATENKAGDPCGIDSIIKALISSIKIAVEHDIDRKKIVIDPAFGGWQGKNSNCDLQLIRDFERLRELDLPIYVGVSRKSTINTLGGGVEPRDRLVGSVVLTQWLIDHGAHIIRTHDVKETVLGLRVMKNIRELG